MCDIVHTAKNLKEGCRVIFKNKTLTVRVTSADKDLCQKAAGLSKQQLGTWARGVLLLMAIWQTEGEVVLKPEHQRMLKTFHALGMNPVKKRRRVA